MWVGHMYLATFVLNSKEVSHKDWRIEIDTVLKMVTNLFRIDGLIGFFQGIRIVALIVWFYA